MNREFNSSKEKIDQITSKNESMERELSQKEVLLSGINQNEEFKIDINNQKIDLEKQIENLENQITSISNQLDF